MNINNNPYRSSKTEPIKEVNANKVKVGRVVEPDTKGIKRAIWLYFFLLIFEGALRKWVLPGLSNPLLIVRDPIAIWIIVVALYRGLVRANIYLSTMVFITIIGIITAVLIGHGSLPVAIYGARITLLHFPLIFIIGRIFTRDDVVKVGKVLLVLSIPMAILVILQFYSPQSAWVNRGVGGDVEGGGFSGAMGYFRPPATFSFITGTVTFFFLVACFVLYFWLQERKVNKMILLAATFAVIIVIPLSISRSLFFSVGVAIMFSLLAISRKPKYIGRMIAAIIGMAAVVMLLGRTSVFQTGIEAFSSRFSSANESEGGLEGVILDRYLGGMVTAFKQSSNMSFFGGGLGLGTNAGAKLLSGNRDFLVSEEEWGRMIGEQGPLFGILAVLIRIFLTIKMAVASYRRMLMKDILPWLLLAFVVLNVPQGQWAQPTSLGFSVLSAGLLLAACKTTRPMLKKVLVRNKQPLTKAN